MPYFYSFFLISEVKRKPKKKTPQELPEYTSEMYANYSAPTEGKQRRNPQEERELTTERRKVIDINIKKILITSTHFIVNKTHEVRHLCCEASSPR